MTLTTDGINYFLGNLYTNASTLGIARTEITQLLTNALGANNFKSATTGVNQNLVFDWRPDIPEEVFVSTISNFVSTPQMPQLGVSPVNFARFSICYRAGVTSNSFAYSRANTNNTDSFSNNEISSTLSGNFGVNTDDLSLCWITANERSVCSFTWDQATGHRLFLWSGVTVDNPVGFETFPANCCLIASVDDGNGNTFEGGTRAVFPNSSTGISVLATGDANYQFNCDDDQTPDDTFFSSDLYLLDDDPGNNNPLTGRCSNLALARGASLEIGKFYNLETAHKDSGTSTFVCAGTWGTDFILMRVTQGATTPGENEPIAINGLLVWLDANDPSTLVLNDSDIDQWNDKSSNGNNAIATANIPQLVGSEVVFDRIAGFDISAVTFSGAAPRTIFVTFKPTTSPSNQVVFNFGVSAGTLDLIVTTGGSINIQAGASGGVQQIPSGTAAYGNWNIVELNYDGTNLKVYVNNVETSDTVIALTTSTQSTGLGYLKVAANFGLNGSIHEFLAYDSALNAADRAIAYASLVSNIPA